MVKQYLDRKYVIEITFNSNAKPPKLVKACDNDIVNMIIKWPYDYI